VQARGGGAAAERLHTSCRHLVAGTEVHVVVISTAHPIPACHAALRRVFADSVPFRAHLKQLVRSRHMPASIDDEHTLPTAVAAVDANPQAGPCHEKERDGGLRWGRGTRKAEESLSFA
jgi:hypothetical protein